MEKEEGRKGRKRKLRMENNRRSGKMKYGKDKKKKYISIKKISR